VARRWWRIVGEVGEHLPGGRRGDVDGLEHGEQGRLLATALRQASIRTCTFCRIIPLGDGGTGTFSSSTASTTTKSQFVCTINLP
jgi:hypothetical protein